MRLGSLKEVTYEIEELCPPYIGAVLYTRGDISFRGLGREY
jgi:hypothetical protein